MIRRILFSIVVVFFLINDVQITSAEHKRGHEAFQFLKETKERVKHGIQCLPPSKYFAGSCYTYMKTTPAPSWERAYNNCLSLPMTKDARLLAIESVEEYEFIERELIGLKSGSESVSVYIGLRKMNNTWFWSNDIPLKETPVYRFWVDNNRDILAYDCGILWLARNTSVITPAPCVEQALRPYVCKQIIDRCYNNSGSCGKYGKCINLPLTNSYKCQCRFFYTGDRCEKWSSEGLQVIIGGVIVVIAFIISCIIDTPWSTYKPSKIVHTSISNEKQCWSTSSSLHKQRYSLKKPKRIILILLPIILTIIICVIILQTRNSMKENLVHSKELLRFCILYDNNYYHHLLTLPIALVITLLIIFNQTRIEYHRLNKEKLKIFIPIPFNPFSKINRFDTMILCGILSHEILEIIEEIFLKTTQMKLMTINGPLFDLIRQIGLIIIISLRYYPIFSVIEMNNANILYYVLCSFYMWLDLILRIFQQTFCVNINPVIQLWQTFEQFKNDFTAKYQSNSLMTTTMFMPEDEDARSGGFRHRFQRFKDRLSFRGRTSTIASTILPYQTPSIPLHSLNWSSIDLNISTSISRNDSQSTFDQFGIDSSIVTVLKYAPYYFCLTYICCRLTYLVIINIYRSFLCCQNETNALKKHIYHEPTFSSHKTLSIESRYVHHLFQKAHRNHKTISFIKSVFYQIYRPNKHFHYSKQILNLYMIAFMLIYSLTFHILQNSFSLLEKIYSFISIPLLILYDELDLPEPKPFNLKYEMIFACFLTAIIYSVQLLLAMKMYQRHMLDAYKGIFRDIPPRSAFKNARLMSKNIHYPGYCIAYLTLGYVIVGNMVFLLLVGLRVLLKHLFLVEELAKICLPILAFYLMKFIIQWFLSRTFFLQKHGNTMVLKNLRVYFVFAYFNFFFDCLLGIVSCVFRVSKVWLATFLYLPRLDYCILGRSLEKVDPGFISYVSFIHMECLHTHPVLVYFCTIVHEQMTRRYQYLQKSKRDMYLYTNHQRIVFRWWLAITLSRNMQLIQFRKHRFRHLNDSSMESLNELLGRKIFNQDRFNSNAVIRNHTTTCTTLLLDVDEQDDRKPSF